MVIKGQAETSRSGLAARVEGKGRSSLMWRLTIACGRPIVPLCDVVREVMGDAYPQLHEERDTIAKWATAEEEGFRHTLTQGQKLLEEIVERTKTAGTSWVAAVDAFKLHDTYGFPY